MARYLATYHGPGTGSWIAGYRTIGAPVEGPVLGWSVIEADSPEDVAALLDDHPFVSRGGSLQINEPAGI